jgi:hypothetical protein
LRDSQATQPVPEQVNVREEVPAPIAAVTAVKKDVSKMDPEGNE